MAVSATHNMMTMWGRSKLYSLHQELLDHLREQRIQDGDIFLYRLYGSVRYDLPIHLRYISQEELFLSAYWRRMTKGATP